MTRPRAVWAFELLHHNGRDLRGLPLLKCKAWLKQLILAANAYWLRYSEGYVLVECGVISMSVIGSVYFLYRKDCGTVG
jgi:hypothetical protein